MESTLLAPSNGFQTEMAQPFSQGGDANMVDQAGSPGPQDEIQSKCFIFKKFLELWWVNFEKKFNFKFFCYPLGTHFWK